MPMHLNRSEVAAQLGIQPQSVSNYLERQWLHGVKIARRWRIDAASVQHLLRTGTPPPMRRAGRQSRNNNTGRR